jgi:hypothetical protein
MRAARAGVRRVGLACGGGGGRLGDVALRRLGCGSGRADPCAFLREGRAGEKRFRIPRRVFSSAARYSGAVLGTSGSPRARLPSISAAAAPSTVERCSEPGWAQPALRASA